MRRQPAMTLITPIVNGLNRRNAPPTMARMDKIREENPAPIRLMAPVSTTSCSPPNRIRITPIA